MDYNPSHVKTPYLTGFVTEQVARGEDKCTATPECKHYTAEQYNNYRAIHQHIGWMPNPHFDPTLLRSSIILPLQVQVQLGKGNMYFHLKPEAKVAIPQVSGAKNCECTTYISDAKFWLDVVLTYEQCPRERAWTKAKVSCSFLWMRYLNVVLMHQHLEIPQGRTHKIQSHQQCNCCFASLLTSMCGANSEVAWDWIHIYFEAL